MFQELLEKTVNQSFLTGKNSPKTNTLGFWENTIVVPIGIDVYRVDIDVYESGENRRMCACINKLKLE